MGVSEYGAGAALTQPTDDPAGGPINPHGRPHPEEYQDWYHEASWNALRGREFLWAAFIWNMFDFSSDSRREGDLTDINEKGLVSYDRRTRKDAFYFYRANWSGQPTLHLVGRRYVDRPYGVVDVKAYRNAAPVRPWVNDADQGMTPCEGGICAWRSVHLRPGTNELRAAAEIAGAAQVDSMQWTFLGSPDSVRIKAGDISGYVSKAGQRYGSDTFFTRGVPAGDNAPGFPASGRTGVGARATRRCANFHEGEVSDRLRVAN